MRNRIIIICTALLFSIQAVKGQYYETGQDPASLKWMQIKTGRFTVIYPENYGKEGLIYAKSFEESYSKQLSLFPEMKFKIPVLIHNFTIQSNGYVSWAPRRIELYPTPDQNTLPFPAEEQLTVHELTHVLQMESLNRGFSKAMSLFFGEQFTGIVASMLPSWLIEGDAVFAESILTESGRGRTPSFQKQLKALLVDNKKTFKYDKILNGSYKDFVPDYYESGFQMVTWALTKYDPSVWTKVLDYTGKNPVTLNPVNFSLSANYNLKKKKLWQETSDSLKVLWTKDIFKNKPEAYEVANPDKHGQYLNYFSPVPAGADSIIAIKTSLTSPPTFVLINTIKKTEKRIHIPGWVYPMFLSYAGGKLVWVEIQTDPRWENREYSVIKLMDLKTRQVVKLSRKSRYLAASLSPDAKIIVAVENSVTNVNSLAVIDAGTGIVSESVPTPGNVYLQHPQWSEDGHKITFIFLAGGGEGIMSFNPEKREWETLIEPARNDLQSSFLRNDSLFFTSSSSGTDNVYLLTPDKKTKVITHSRFGITDVSYDGNKLIFSDYSISGNNICTAQVPVIPKEVQDHTGASAFLLNRYAIKHPVVSDTSRFAYTPVPYRKWQHLFRFHSWMPFYTDIQEFQIDPASARPGVSLLTQNTLSTLTSTIGYEYSADKRNVFHTRITWKGWYPVFESKLDYGILPGIYKMGANVANPSNIQTGINFTTTISLPLQFSSGRYSEYVRPSLTAEYVNQYIFIKEKGTYDFGQTILTGRLYFTNYYVSALRDIYPRWAQTFDLNYCLAPFDKAIYGSALSLKTAFYFPGFLPNNGIRIRLETEKQDPEKYLYQNFSSLPRGYYNIISKQISFLSADYVMPLIYPDFNLASLLYLKRIRAGLFYDNAFGPGNAMYIFGTNGLVPIYNTSEITSFKSYGVEVLADFHLLRIPYMISAGVQTAWKSLYELPSFELLFNIDLFGMIIRKRKM